MIKGLDMKRQLPRTRARQSGFTLIELMITVAVVGILAMIAYPSYVNSITKSKRRIAEACLSNFATHMERFYTTNLRYDQTSAGAAMNTTALLALGLDCASAQNSGANYDYSIDDVDQSTYTLLATPKGVQASRDAACGTLTLDQTGAKDASGESGVAGCW